MLPGGGGISDEKKTALSSNFKIFYYGGQVFCLITPTAVVPITSGKSLTRHFNIKMRCRGGTLRSAAETTSYLFHWKSSCSWI